MIIAEKNGITREFSQKSWNLNNKGWNRIEATPTDLVDEVKKRGRKAKIESQETPTEDVTEDQGQDNG